MDKTMESIAGIIHAARNAGATVQQVADAVKAALTAATQGGGEQADDGL